MSSLYRCDAISSVAIWNSNANRLINSYQEEGEQTSTLTSPCKSSDGDDTGVSMLPTTWLLDHKPQWVAAELWCDDSRLHYHVDGTVEVSFMMINFKSAKDSQKEFASVQGKDSIALVWQTCGHEKRRPRSPVFKPLCPLQRAFPCPPFFPSPFAATLPPSLSGRRGRQPRPGLGLMLDGRPSGAAGAASGAACSAQERGPGLALRWTSEC